MTTKAPSSSSSPSSHITANNSSIITIINPHNYISIHTIYITACVLRIIFLIYGTWQDNVLQVKYTDIDYSVYTDAARVVWNDSASPYQRATYRYTPLLAWLLVPGVVLNMESIYGKLLFTCADLLCGWLVDCLIVDSQQRGDVNVGRGSQTLRLQCLALALLNPLLLTVSTRGNADSFVCALCLAVIYAAKREHWMQCGVLFGIAVHFKLYPIVYAPALMMYAGRQRVKIYQRNNMWTKLYTSLIPPNRSQLQVGLSAAAILTALSAFFFAIYGHEFVYHTYAYHLTRVDHRHNFSMWHYLLYLQLDRPPSALITFAPQIILIAFIAVKLSEQLELSIFMATLVFVAFNKVCTAQYFIWWIVYLPLLLPAATSKHSAISMRSWLFAAGMWAASEGHWLYWGYQLEFLGEPVFLQLWIAGMLFFAANLNLVSVAYQACVTTAVTTAAGNSAD